MGQWNRWIQAAAWVSFSGILYLILTGAVGPWIGLPDLGNVGFTIVFVLFALLHCAATEGWLRTGIFFAVSAVVSYLMEDAGVQTGLVFGRYHYGDLLGIKLGAVPVLIPLAWFMMIYPSSRVARAILSGLHLESVFGVTALGAVAAFAMTGWDMVMDPGMAADGNWTWETGGAYFGVPRHNYLGWLLTTFLVYCIAGWLWRWRKLADNSGHFAAPSRVFRALPVIVYAFFAGRYVAENRIPALQLIAMFSMGVPALVAVLRLCLDRGDGSAIA